MNQKELGEIRRHLTAERACIGKIYGCFVNVAKEIIATTEASVSLMPEDELERYLSLFKKTLSGGIGRSLMAIDFSTEQVRDGEEHQLLMKLRNSAASDAEARTAFFRRIIDTVDLKDTNYLILLAADAYDVPWRSRDGQESERDSDTMFSYILCAICPVADGKTNLGYDAGEKDFHNCTSAQTVAAPEMGFMFPAFDGRRANIYNALYYSRNTADVHQSFIESFFRTEAPMSAGIQRDTFESILTKTLEDSCRFDVIQTVHEQIRDRIDAHKESKDPEPLDFSARDVGAILRGQEIPEEKITAFQTKCTEAFGPGAALDASNIIDAKKFQLTMPQVKISVTPEYSAMIETRIIDGRKYILVPADEGVEINGIAVKIPSTEKE
ncbi:MAG: DUF4317 domain-containing protein [Ruminococcaceae bacterium]|nr:DUF4317 domain-containing protein [Oscillospiraceae bacterium]